MRGSPILWPSLTLRGLAQAASSLADDRYTGSFTVPSSVPFLLAVTYAAALLSPFAARGLSRTRGFLVVLGPLLGATAYAMITTARAGLFTAIFFTIAGWLVSSIRQRGRTPRPGLRGLVGVLAGAAGVIALFVGIALLRAGSASPYYVRFALNRLAIYAVGYMPGFSHWYDASTPTTPVAWGSASLAGLTKYLGGNPRYGQALTDFAPLGDGGQTNIYTAWRYLITDFGWAFAPFAAAIIGYLITVAWQRSIRRPGTGATVGCLAAYAYLLHSVTLPIFTFTNVVVAFVIAWVALAMKPPTVKEKLRPVSPHERAVERARAAASSG